LKQSHRFFGELEVWEDIYNERINVDVAIYGSSRAWVHINPQIIEDSVGLSAYNFGIDGHNFWLQYFRHKEYLKYNPKPKAIIVSVDAFSLEKRDELFNQYQFLPYMLWNWTLKRYTSSYKGYKQIDYYIPFIRYFGKRSVLPSLPSILSKKRDNSSLRTNGYRGMERQWNADFENAMKTMKDYVVRLDTSSIELFEEFILECKELNIELILVYTPEYIEGQKFIKNKKDIVNIFLKLADKYQILYLDYSNDKICFNRNYFYNSMHLNGEGADLFTKILVNDIKHDRKIFCISNGKECAIN
jgi:hypothetical protein